MRAVFVWAVVLATVVLPRVQPPAVAAQPVRPFVGQLTAFQQQSVIGSVREQRIQSAEIAQAEAWSQEYDQGWNKYQARLAAQAEAQAVAARIAALSNHAPPPPYIAKIINDAFSPLGDRALQWAVNVAYCESRYHPTSVNSSSGASGLFQFLPSTWAFTPYHAQSPFDPVANANAAAWLYKRDGPSQWQCQG
ncbi:MAG TPA: transglycosylase SLT domain-containing protein [Candidatus Dormibacteraeota bacterium]|nr:transglycosylase SLT domain-containing protein [Candidatus Dormibacteraeota bacterium]